MTDDQIARLNAALEGRYRVERELGEGGMALVYLATDLKHNREVAIKVLKSDLAAVVGEDRFLSEIETTAKLQHPNILPLFDSGATDGFLYYAMPYVKGETLRERLKREVQLPVEQAMDLIQKIAAALAYAHEQGVVHRDIKPANILLSSGEPLIADFGIALAVSQANDGRRTETGLSLGTPHYMSPEQAAGDRSLDPRSDIYALGCILQELLTGEPPFSGANAQAVLARILTSKPTRVTSLRPTVPPHVESVIAKSLEKLPADRFTTAKDFRKALSDPDFRHVVTDHTIGTAAVPAPATRVRTRTNPVLVAGAMGAALVVGLLGGGLLLGGGESEPASTIRADFDFSSIGYDGTGFVDFTLSAGGTMLAASGEVDGDEAIYVRDTDQTDFRKVPNTDGGTAPTFSPDGEWIAFRHGESDELRKVTVSGGSLTTLVNADTISPYFPHWGTDGRIVFTGPEGIFVTSAASGSLDDLVPMSALEVAPDPFLLPGGEGVLSSGFDGSGIRYSPVGSDTSWVVASDGVQPTWTESGHLFYVSPDGGLFAVRFDPGTGQPSGTPVRVLDRVAASFEGPGYAISRLGHLVHADGDPESFANATGDVTYGVYTPGGEVEELPLPPSFLLDVRVSPDGRFLAYPNGTNPQARFIYTYDLLTGDTEQLTFEGDSYEPIWSPDGEWILFGTDTGSGSILSVVPADGRAEAQQVASTDRELLLPTDWASEGTVLFDRSVPGEADVYRASLVREGDTWSLADEQPYLSGSWIEREATFSPSGDLVAHVSMRSASTPELYVSSWPEPTTQSRGTTRQACCVADPRWAPDGGSIYFGVAPDTLYRVPVERDPLRLLEPEVVYARGDFRLSDVFPDGRLIFELYGEPSDDGAGSDRQLRHFFVVNWDAEFARRLEDAGR